MATETNNSRLVKYLTGTTEQYNSLKESENFNEWAYYYLIDTNETGQKTYSLYLGKILLSTGDDSSAIAALADRITFLEQNGTGGGGSGVGGHNFYEGTSLPSTTAYKENDVYIVIQDVPGNATQKYRTAYYLGKDANNTLVWKAMAGNYNASNVYFDDDFTFTTNIGTVTGITTSKTVEAEGKNIKQFFAGLFAEEKAPSIDSQPSVTISIGNGENSTPANSNITVEGGTVITPKWSTTFSKGSYSFGPDTGLTPSWAIQGYIGTNKEDGHVSTSTAGTFSSVTLAAGKEYTIKATASYGDAPLAYTNLGNIYTEGNTLFDETKDATEIQIKSGSKTSTSKSISAWQQGYYIGTFENASTEVTSDILRNIGTGQGILKNRKVKGGNYAAATDLSFQSSGTMAKFVLAYPASKDTDNNGKYVSTKGLQSFFNNSSFEEYFGNFTRTVLKVAGADGDTTSSHAVDYAVWTWAPDAAFETEAGKTINFLIDLK